MSRSHKKYCIIIKNININLQDPKNKKKIDELINKYFSIYDIKVYEIYYSLLFFLGFAINNGKVEITKNENFGNLLRNKHNISKLKGVILNLGFKIKVKSISEYSGNDIILALPDGCKLCPKCKGWRSSCNYCNNTGNVKWTKFID